MLAWYAALNAMLGPPPHAYAQSGERNGIIVRDFFDRLAGEERRNGSRDGLELRADKPTDWPIVIDTRRK
jgi:hypothetical protein